MNKERAYVQLISKLLNVEFDAIWQRHKRLLIQKTITWTVGIIAVLSALFSVWLTNQPVDVELRLNETSYHNENMPPLKNAIITMTLDNETKADTIPSFNSSVTFTNIPHRYINKKVRVMMTCQNFLPVDTVILLTEQAYIDIQRDPKVFGNVRFRLWNPDTEKTAVAQILTVDGHQARSDSDGYVTLSILLAEQKTAYPIKASSLSLIDSLIIMPCGSDDVILFNGTD
jgi:hypothetical protein